MARLKGTYISHSKQQWTPWTFENENELVMLESTGDIDSDIMIA